MKRTVTILGGDERMAWLAESLRREGYIIRLAALLPPAPLKNRLPQPETPDRLLPESETVILAVPTVGPDVMLRTPTVPECYPLAECLRRLPEGAMVLGGTLPPDCRKIAEEQHLAYTDLLALPDEVRQPISDLIALLREAAPMHAADIPTDSMIREFIGQGEFEY